MKIDKSKVENQQITLTLHVEESEIEKYLNKAAQKLSNQLKICLLYTSDAADE